MQEIDFKRIAFWGIVWSCVVIITGWFIALREGEASRLAAAAMEMLNSYQNTGSSDSTGVLGSESPLALWISGITMAVLGPNHIAFRIPAFIATLFCLFSVHRLARLYYSKEISRLVTLITATLPSTFLLNQEVTADTYATAFYTFMVWQLAAYFRHKRLQNFVLSMAGLVLVVLSKGTIDNTSPHFSPLNLTLTLLWAFLPWTLFLIYGLVSKVKELLKASNRHLPSYQYIPLLAFVIPFIVISINPYQTSSDAFLLYPTGALFAAESIARIFYGESDPVLKRRFYILQNVLFYIVLAGLFWLVWYPFSDNNYFGLIHYLGTLSIVTWLVVFSSYTNKMLIACGVLAIGGNLVLTSYYYPNLSDYQAGAKLGAVAKSDGVSNGRFFSYQAGTSSTLEFYSGVTVRETKDFKKLIAQKNCWIYTDQRLLEEFRAVRPDLKILGTSADFPFADFNTTFLNPVTRNKVVSQKTLLKL